MACRRSRVRVPVAPPIPPLAPSADAAAQQGSFGRGSARRAPPSEGRPTPAHGHGGDDQPDGEHRRVQKAQLTKDCKFYCDPDHLAATNREGEERSDPAPRKTKAGDHQRADAKEPSRMSPGMGRAGKGLQGRICTFHCMAPSSGLIRIPIPPPTAPIPSKARNATHALTARLSSGLGTSATWRAAIESLVIDRKSTRLNSSHAN